MTILIYRRKESDVGLAVSEMQNKMLEMMTRLPFNICKEIKCLHNKRLIEIYPYNGEPIRIDFRCGRPERLAGMRIKYYNTDCYYASKYIEQMAWRCDGCELANLDYIIQLIVYYLMTLKTVG